VDFPSSKNAENALNTLNGVPVPGTNPVSENSMKALIDGNSNLLLITDNKMPFSCGLSNSNTSPAK
jgi:hypothetical protein